VKGITYMTGFRRTRITI